MKIKPQSLAITALAAVGSLAAIADADICSATMESVIAVDTRSGGVRAVAPADIGYSPAWGGVKDAGAYVVLSKVEHAGMFNAVTSVVAICAADGEGEHSYSVGDGEVPCVRLIHQTYSAEGLEIGKALVRDVAFSFSSAPGDAFVADSRANSLQDAVKRGEAVNLAYATAWATNAVQVSLHTVKLSGPSGEAVATNGLFVAEAGAEGVVQLKGISSGWWRLLCRLTDRSGEVLLEYLTDGFRRNGGLVLYVH